MTPPSDLREEIERLRPCEWREALLSPMQADLTLGARALESTAYEATKGLGAWAGRGRPCDGPAFLEFPPILDQSDRTPGRETA